MRTIDFTPPDIDSRSFNAFLRLLASRSDADTIALPDSIVANSSKEKSTEVGGGVAYRLPWRNAVVGAEVHVSRGTFEQTLSGEGPNPEAWDVRFGAEYPATQTLTARGGYIRRRVDQDALTRQNEFISNTFTAGFALHSVTSGWTLETGYGVGWGAPDFGDPVRQRSSGQQGLVRLGWFF